MDYLTNLLSKPQDKLALITEQGSYSYGELARRALELREQYSFTSPVQFIHRSTILEQLLNFIALSGTATVPVIATEESRGNIYEITSVPANAVMGAMTSGSTGKSKLLWRSYGSWADFFPEQNRVFNFDEDTIIFCQGSLAFTGNLNIYMGILDLGATLVCTERFRPKTWLKMMAQHKANAIYLVPSKLMLLTKNMTYPNELIRSIVCGSSSMGRQEADRVADLFPNSELTLYYGASELNYITYIRGREMTEDRTDIGLPFKGVGIAIRNEEIYIDTPYHIEGIELPFTLKDRGSIDAAGHLHFLGRTDDILSVNGRKVSSMKVEEALRALPGINELVVLSLHEGDEDMLTAFIAMEPGTCYTKHELVKLLNEGYLDAYEVPKRFVFMDELPKNESGKIDKKKLLRG